jgi:hypothetical protein
MDTNLRFLRAACALAGLSSAVLAQMAWTQAATTGPIARSAHMMAQDSQRGRTVLFGGLAWDNYIGHFSFGDTWEWDGRAWTQFATTGPRPVARSYAAMVYDSQLRQTVLFGGSNVNGDFGDTWAWNGSTWTQLDNTGPARHWHAMAYDSQRGRIVMFGGAGNGGSTWFGDTWEWDGVSWTQVATTGPGIRIQPSMVYDSQRGKTVLFGGLGNSGNTWFGDTLEWDGSTWTQIATTGPSSRFRSAMVYDSQRNKAVLFGGFHNYAPQNDTWELAGSTWTQVAWTGPSGRGGHAMVYDLTSQKVVLFGGYIQTSSEEIYYRDTWERGAFDSTAATFRSGCGSPALDLSPVANARPAINTVAQASLHNIPSTQAFVALGWSRTMFESHPLPYLLAGYGMTGCYLLHSADTTAQPVTFTSPADANYSLPVPNWAGLIGLHVYLQGWAYAPGANAGNVIVSNGLDWRIGSL